MKTLIPLLLLICSKGFSQNCDPRNTYYLCHIKSEVCMDSLEEDIYGFYQFHATSYVANKINQALGYFETDLPKSSYPFYNDGWTHIPDNWLVQAVEHDYELIETPLPHTVAYLSSAETDHPHFSGGHLGWVEAVKPDGSFIVSFYNGLPCQFTVREVTPHAATHFIVIPGVETSEEISEAYLKASARLYRDPHSGQLMLEINGPGPYEGKAELFNLQENRYYTLPLTGKFTQIPQTHIIPGEYQARITLPNRVITTKVNVME